jgi:tetratricopeptide (TPR) repeat protein
MAKENFSRALVNAKIGRLGPIAEAEAASKLARVLGNMCEYDEAESMFLQALAAEEAAFGANSPRTVPTRVELAQFTFDIGRYQKAINYFEKAFEVGGEILGRTDRSGYARLLDDYSVALERSGNTAAAEVQSKARSLRAGVQSSGPSLVNAGADYVPYPKSCR